VSESVQTTEIKPEIAQEQTAGEGTAQPETPAGKPGKTKKAKKLKEPKKPKDPKKKKRKKRIIIASILLAVAGGIAFGMYKLLSAEEVVPPLTDFVMLGSIEEAVQGSGVTTAKESANVTTKSSGKLLELYVSTGQQVAEGDPLFKMDPTEAQTALDSAKETLSGYQEQLDAIHDKIADMTVSAPFSGKLMDVAVNLDDAVTTGTKAARLVDDSVMKLTLYFSYAYEGSIKEGMPASVSIPQSMAVVNGTVTSVKMVRKVTEEGAVLFEVNISAENPGTLTEGMAATATIVSAGGEAMVPSEAGKLEFNRTADILIQADGTVNSLNMDNYAAVSAGEVLLTIENDGYDEEIATLNDQIATATKTVTEAQDALNACSAVSPMSGTVMSVSGMVGDTISTGTVVVTVADTSVIVVEAQIDEVDVGRVSVGMPVTISQDYSESGMGYTGVLTSISLTGKYENGVSYFPAYIEVQNDGTLMSGMYVSYNMVVAQADGVLMAPVPAIQYTEAGTFLFVKAETPPENAADLGESVVPEGFYAVPVETGMSNDTYVEIISGATEGMEIYTQSMGAGMEGGMYYGKG